MTTAGPVGDELHALRDVVGTDGMHDEMIAGGHRRQGDLLADDVDVHAEAAVEFDRLLRRLSRLRLGGLHVEAVPVAAVEQVDARIDDVGGSGGFMHVAPAPLAAFPASVIGPDAVVCFTATTLVMR
jgi:hypothetical protein